MDQKINIRTISPADNAAIAHIIRATLLEFGAARPGTVYYDESTDRLSEIFYRPGSVYYIAEQDGVIMGGAGIYPTDGLGDATCELVKMYLLPAARGIGLGRMLMERCIDFAREQGYKQIYLETMPELSQAIGLYEKVGFDRLSAPLGSSGHFGCGIWMKMKVQGDQSIS
jgi:putative acetyltransferase